MIFWLLFACAPKELPPPVAAAPVEARLSAPARSAYLQGEVALARGDLPEAERLFRRAVVFDGVSAEPRVALAEVLLDSGRPDEARVLIEAVLLRYPEDPGALVLMGRLSN